MVQMVYVVYLQFAILKFQLLNSNILNIINIINILNILNIIFTDKQ